MIEHISHEYNRELEEVRNKVITMGALVEEQLHGATSSLLKKKHERAEKVVASDYKINALEVEIDELCTQVIATRQPAATDLRLLFTAIKVITDLERVGDESEKIAGYALKLMDDSTVSYFRKEIKHIAKLARELLKESLDSYARMDDNKAMIIAARDVEIDEEFDSLSRSLITYMIEDSRNIKNVLMVNWCARALERVGDHAKNICEYVVYLVQGKDIRHTGELLD